jgi:acyl-CoA reductase-like NAD-dependent aldehyde dehydrogenase
MAKGCLEVASPNYCRETVKYGIVGINDGIISTEIAPFGGTKESSIGPIWESGELEIWHRGIARRRTRSVSCR